MKNRLSLLSPFSRNAQQTSVNTAVWCSGYISYATYCQEADFSSGFGPFWALSKANSDGQLRNYGVKLFTIYTITFKMTMLSFSEPYLRTVKLRKLIRHSNKINNNLTNGENYVSTISTSSQRHTLPNREYIRSNSEVIILNNDQHQHQENNINKQQDQLKD